MKKTCISFTIVFVLIMMVAAPAVRAQLTTPLVPQRTNTAGTLANVVAGPCLPGLVCDAQNSALAAEFPRVVQCPADCNNVLNPATGQPLNGEFLRWDIQITPLFKISPSLVAVEVSADIGIEGAIGIPTSGTPCQPNVTLPCTGDSSLGISADCASRWLKFSCNSANQPFLVSYFTKTGIGVGPEGVIVKSGNSIPNVLLAGAGSVSTGCAEESQPLVIEETLNLPGCFVSYRIGPNSKPIPGSLEILVSKPGQTCTLGETGELKLYTSIDGKTERVLYFPGEGIVTGGSCTYVSKVPTAYGYSYQRVTCTTCCPYGTNSCCVSGQSCNQVGKICCNGSWLTQTTCP